ncbi:Haloacid dehalogenase-like hydrolase (HAD) superfamily protein [Zea mays]|uniref:Haloacid dehalogenase-like hydrolase (HAD) superfamily protein n=1 Tax=Zea mays TaxID=4577 RepID=C0PNG1_MAIZE|nr:unknown [Zea mays]AQK63085.1 Haloacid dehalogenase-like hydrolase (HAD) superfamily protein [Zea mays]
MSDERVKAEALQILGLFQVLPRLVVFDLDYTLWPFYCECRSKRDSPSLFRHARGIMYALKEKGIDMAIASRSPTPDIAKVFLDKLEFQSMFVAQVRILPQPAVIFVWVVVSLSAYKNSLMQHSSGKLFL